MPSPVRRAPAAPDYEIRTPREPDSGYRAQLWVKEGHWVVGRNYPDTAQARGAAEQFAASRPVPPAPGEVTPGNWFRRRRKPDEDAPRWVRRCKGGAYQSRPWVGPQLGSINLGLFTLAENDNDWRLAEWSASRASKAFVKLYKPHQEWGLREVLEELKRRRWVPEGLMPPRVRRIAAGFVGRVKKGGRVIETDVFADEWDAFDAINNLIATTFPKGPRPKPAPRPRTRKVVADAEEEGRAVLVAIVGTLVGYSSSLSAARGSSPTGSAFQLPPTRANSASSTSTAARMPS